ncbi:uncharacterized protein LOC109136520 [Beta vulgaris subsp. vulgaris]|uniref:uncharacterized protein LOC109136520 n=1 Tax=Beta vulgaris subsp. vulgaris TaxID=3555 RepID=UPI0020372A7F|nr:uncharacterized protein LOC109136520 [Beta vulgaris subsp. vulgaris]
MLPELSPPASPAFSRLSETCALRSPYSSLSCVVLLLCFLSPVLVSSLRLVAAAVVCCYLAGAQQALRSSASEASKPPILHPFVLRCSRRAELRKPPSTPLFLDSSLLLIEQRVKHCCRFGVMSSGF